jgi:hypothetical protein
MTLSPAARLTLMILFFCFVAGPAAAYALVALAMAVG